MKNILVPIDFSQITGDVIEKAASLALTYGSRIWLIHVISSDFHVGGAGEDPKSLRDKAAKTLHAKRQRLQDEAHVLRNKGINVTARIIEGPTVKTILKEAAEIEAELIVLGSYRDSSLYRYLLGSVSEGVLGGAACPLMIVPCQETRFSAA